MYKAVLEPPAATSLEVQRQRLSGSSDSLPWAQTALEYESEQGPLGLLWVLLRLRLVLARRVLNVACIFFVFLRPESLWSNPAINGL